MNNTLTRICPICKEQLMISELSCLNCNVKIHGNFIIPNLLILDDNMMTFLKIFLIARGNIKEAERQLNISYPTVKKKLDELINILGLESQKFAKDINKMLDDLEDNKINIEEIIRQTKRR
jgi:hypothetical protein